MSANGSEHRRTVACPSAEDIFFFSEGLLEGDEARTVSAHLRACEMCSARYLEEVELTTSLRESPVPEPAAGWTGAVLRSIRERREESSWWWIVAFGLLIASGARWLVAADLSPTRAAGLVVDRVFVLGDGLAALVARLGDLETWEQVVRAAAAFLGAVSSSPTWLTATVAAAAMVALAANALLWSVVRRYLAVGG